MANMGGKIGMKLLTAAVGIPVGILVREVVERVWLAAGPDRPRSAEQQGVQWADAIAWAALSGVGMVIADLVTQRGAVEAYRVLVGSEPPVAPRPKASKRIAKAGKKGKIGPAADVAQPA
jgi:Protein of unknown function (DUF4235)